MAGSWPRSSPLSGLTLLIRFRFARQGIMKARIPFAPPTSLRLRGRFTRSANQTRITPPFRGVLERKARWLPTGDARSCAPRPPLAPIVSVRDSGGPASPEHRFAGGLPPTRPAPARSRAETPAPSNPWAGRHASSATLSSRGRAASQRALTRRCRVRGMPAVADARRSSR